VSPTVRVTNNGEVTALGKGDVWDRRAVFRTGTRSSTRSPGPPSSMVS
jgi:hypothetical protein